MNCHKVISGQSKKRPDDLKILAEGGGEEALFANKSGAFDAELSIYVQPISWRIL